MEPISWQAKGLLVEEELKNHKSEVDDIGGTAVERHQNLIERADGEYYQGQNEANLEEAETHLIICM